MTKLGGEGARLARPLAALLVFAQLDEPGGEVGQGGTAMLLKRRVEGVCGSAELEVAIRGRWWW